MRLPKSFNLLIEVNLCRMSLWMERRFFSKRFAFLFATVVTERFNSIEVNLSHMWIDDLNDLRFYLGLSEQIDLIVI
jgi:hypothetical protein